MVQVIGGPYGKAIVYRTTANKRGWSISKAEWRMHGYTLQDLPAITWVGATRYNLVWVGSKPFYVYDPQVKLCDSLLNRHRRLGQPISLPARPR